MPPLFLSGPCLSGELALDRDALARLDPRQQVEDVGHLAAGRQGKAVRFAALIDAADPSAETRFVHVASSDGTFTANLTLAQARAGGLILYEYRGAPLPAEFGGPFRLLFVDGEDCSVSVKFLGRIEFLRAGDTHRSLLRRDVGAAEVGAHGHYGATGQRATLVPHGHPPRQRAAP